MPNPPPLRYQVSLHPPTHPQLPQGLLSPTVYQVSPS